MLDKLEAIKARFEKIGTSLTNPEVVADNRKFSALSREYRELEKVVEAYHRYRKLLDETITLNFYPATEEQREQYIATNPAPADYVVLIGSLIPEPADA